VTVVVVVMMAVIGMLRVGHTTAPCLVLTNVHKDQP
jgi:hypothetical protein